MQPVLCTLTGEASSRIFFDGVFKQHMAEAACLISIVVNRSNVGHEDLQGNLELIRLVSQKPAPEATQMLNQLEGPHYVYVDLTFDSTKMQAQEMLCHRAMH